MKRVVMLWAALITACTESGALDTRLVASRTALGGTAASIKEAMKSSVALDAAATVISETEFLRLSGASISPAPVGRRDAAAQAAAMLIDPTALGVFATYKANAKIAGDVFIVVRDGARSPDGSVEGRDAYVVAGKLNGTVEWAGTQPRLAVNVSKFEAERCESRTRGCHSLLGVGATGPLPHRRASSGADGAGLSKGIVINDEAPPGASNASGFSPSLALHRVAGESPNRFQCHGRIAATACTQGPLTGGGFISGNAPSKQRLPVAAVMISENDYLALVNAGGSAAATGAKGEAVQVATLGNADEAVGVFGQVGYDKTIDAETFIVARDARVSSSGTVEASQYYVASAHLAGRVSWVGTGLSMGLTGPVGRYSTFVGPCGAVSFTADAPVCDTPRCLPENIGTSTSAPQTGSERWPAGNRVTLRIPDLSLPTRDSTRFACSEFQPPVPQTPCSALVFVPAETCNGVDDDCDGAIDENDVCGTRNTSCACRPSTCQQQGITCGTTNDGCGQVLTCGAPCP